MPLPFNITNPGIWIDGILTAGEQTFVTNLFGLNYEQGDILYADATGELVLLKAGIDGQSIVQTAGVPAWATPAGGGDFLASGAIPMTGDFNAGNNNIVNLNYIDFDAIVAPVYGEGRLFYDAATNSMSYYNDVNGVMVNLGQEVLVEVYNNTGVTLTNGSVVYENGNDVGTQLPTVALAKADSGLTSDIAGVVTEDIPNNTTGYITSMGVVRGLNTSAFNNGEKLYLSEITAGAFTNVAPSRPNKIVSIGRVNFKNAVNGEVLIQITEDIPDFSAAGKYWYGGLDGLVEEGDIIDSVIGISGNASDTSFVTSQAVVDYVGEAINFLQDFFFNDTPDAIGGIYYQMTDQDLDELGSTLVSGTLTAGNDQPLFNFINDTGLGITKLQGGIYQIHMHALKTGTKATTISAKIYTRTSGGTETLIGSTVPSAVVGLTDAGYTIEAVIPETVVNTTDKLVVKFFANVGASGSDVTVTLNLEDNFNSRIAVPVSVEILSQVYLRQGNNLSELTDPATARINLGLEIGTDVQAAGVYPGITSGAGAPVSTPTQVGDIYIDTTADDAYIAVGTASSADWEKSNDGGGAGSGDVVGPASSTDNAIARFDGITGKLIQNSALTISDTGIISDTSSLTEYHGLYQIQVSSLNFIDDTAINVLGNAVTQFLDVSTNEYVLNGLNGFSSNNKRIRNVLDPVDVQDAATKAYADSKLSSSLTVPPAVDDTYEGISTNDVNAGATIAQWEVVYLDVTPDWNLTDASAEATAGGVQVALATEAGTATNPLNVLLSGVARNNTWAWTPGLPIYISETAGAITQTKPIATDSVTRILGYALTATSINFSPDNSWVVHV